MSDPSILTPPVPPDVEDLILRAAPYVYPAVDLEVIGRSTDGWPPGLFTYFGTERASDEPSMTFEDRRSRCYELAGYALAFGTAPDKSVLVHGTQHGPDAAERIGHAWLVLPDPTLVWEPVTACIYDAAAWKAFAQIRDEAAYTLPLLRRLLLRHRHFGRWHDSRYH